MKRSLAITLTVLFVAGCAALRDRDQNPYENPFYAKYLNTGSTLDAQISRTIDLLHENPNSPTLHNELGTLLVQKGFPKDAKVEFRRALDADGDFYSAWYNLALVNASLGEHDAAHRALEKTVDLKPGHAAALFQLGLVEETRGNREAAVKYYAKAFRHNPKLLEVAANPRILDSRLVHLALLELYPTQQARQSMQLHGAPAGYRDPQPAAPAAPEQAPSPQAKPEQILAPVAPVTDPATQTTT